MPTTDVLIIGSGAAGCAAALRAADQGLDVIMITNAAVTGDGSNTSWAQGGIVYRGLEDSPELLARDIHEAGGGICYPEAVQYLASRGPQLVQELLIDRCATPFDREHGELSLTEEAAHSCPRIIHVKDQTGLAISKALAAEVARNPRIRVVTGATAVDLIMRGFHTRNPVNIYKRERCLGAYVLVSGYVEVFVARETIVATGGLGQIYLHSTNPPNARGDGLSMAYRAGARVINLEYIQFHPTAFYHQLAPRFLLTEALRGEGARLVDARGNRFMGKYSPREELAPRDVVARAIHEEMLAAGAPSMYLDISHRDAGYLRDRFPTIHAFCLQYGIDMTKEPIPVVPAAHYSCGGIGVDLRGRTNVQGLRAVGEVACTGVHGANRLASTSLLEAILWGWSAAEGIHDDRDENPRPNEHEVEPWRLETEAADPAYMNQDWLTIKHTMWNYVGLVRTTRNMSRALHILRDLQLEVETFYRRARLDDALLGLRNGVQAALAVTHQALRNRSSRGTHYRIG
jgi:L-aspartate oxidase